MEEKASIVRMGLWVTVLVPLYKQINKQANK